MFQSPFILASGPPTRNAAMISQAFEIGWGAAVTKTVCLNHEEMNDVTGRIHIVNGGIQNLELISPIPAEQWAKDIRKLKIKYPDKIIIASISAEADNMAGWQKLAQMMQNAGSDGLELNFSCPHGLPELGMGNTCSDSPELSAEIIKSIKQVSNLPVWAKLSPNIADIAALALICEKAGADGITAINTVKGFAGIDINTGLPKQSVKDFSACGGLSGQLIKPIALKAVAEIASVVNCLVSASGGITNWQDAVEFILLGATTVQICTEVMLKGYDIIENLNSGLEKYLDKKSINSIQGSSIKYIKPFSQLDKTYKQTYQIIPENCIRCGKCLVSCADAGYQAITQNNTNIPCINNERCSGCGLCAVVCPVNCIKTAQSFAIK